jgi:hypothetical protein
MIDLISAISGEAKPQPALDDFPSAELNPTLISQLTN